MLEMSRVAKNYILKIIFPTLKGGKGATTHMGPV